MIYFLKTSLLSIKNLKKIFFYLNLCFFLFNTDAQAIPCDDIFKPNSTTPSATSSITPSATSVVRQFLEEKLGAQFLSKMGENWEQRFQSYSNRWTASNMTALLTYLEERIGTEQTIERLKTPSYFNYSSSYSHFIETVKYYESKLGPDGVTQRLQSSLRGFFLPKSQTNQPNQTDRLEEIKIVIEWIESILGTDRTRKLMLRNLGAFSYINGKEIKEIYSYLHKQRGISKKNIQRIIEKNPENFSGIKKDELIEVIDFLENQIEIKKKNTDSKGNIVNQMILNSFQGFKIKPEKLKTIVDYLTQPITDGGRNLKKYHVKQMIISSLEDFLFIKTDSLKLLIQTLKDQYNLSEENINNMMKKSLYFFHKIQPEDLKQVTQFLNKEYEITEKKINEILERKPQNFIVTAKKVKAIAEFLRVNRKINRKDLIQMLEENPSSFDIPLQNLKTLIQFLENKRQISKKQVNQMLKHLENWHVNPENVESLTLYLEEELRIERDEINEMIIKDLNAFRAKPEEIKALKTFLTKDLLMSEKRAIDIIKKKLKFIHTISIDNTKDLITFFENKMNMNQITVHLLLEHRLEDFITFPEDVGAFYEFLKKNLNLSEHKIQRIITSNLKTIATISIKNIEVLINLLKNQLNLKSEAIHLMLERYLDHFTVFIEDIEPTLRFLTHVLNMDQTSIQRMIQTKLKYFSIPKEQLQNLIQQLQDFIKEIKPKRLRINETKIIHQILFKNLQLFYHNHLNKLKLMVAKSLKNWAPMTPSQNPKKPHTPTNQPNPNQENTITHTPSKERTPYDYRENSQTDPHLKTIQHINDLRDSLLIFIEDINQDFFTDILNEGIHHINPEIRKATIEFNPLNQTNLTTHQIEKLNSIKPMFIDFKFKILKIGVQDTQSHIIQTALEETYNLLLTELLPNATLDQRIVEIWKAASQNQDPKAYIQVIQSTFDTIIFHLLKKQETLSNQAPLNETIEETLNFLVHLVDSPPNQTPPIPIPDPMATKITTTLNQMIDSMERRPSPPNTIHYKIKGAFTLHKMQLIIQKFPSSFKPLLNRVQTLKNLWIHQVIQELTFQPLNLKEKMKSFDFKPKNQSPEIDTQLLLSFFDLSTKDTNLKIQMDALQTAIDYYLTKKEDPLNTKESLIKTLNTFIEHANHTVRKEVLILSYELLKMKTKYTHSELTLHLNEDQKKVLEVLSQSEGQIIELLQKSKQNKNNTELRKLASYLLMLRNRESEFHEFEKQLKNRIHQVIDSYLTDTNQTQSKEELILFLDKNKKNNNLEIRKSLTQFQFIETLEANENIDRNFIDLLREKKLQILTSYAQDQNVTLLQIEIQEIFHLMTQLHKIGLTAPKNIWTKITKNVSHLFKKKGTYFNENEKEKEILTTFLKSVLKYLQSFPVSQTQEQSSNHQQEVKIEELSITELTKQIKIQSHSLLDQKTQSLKVVQTETPEPLYLNYLKTTHSSINEKMDLLFLIDTTLKIKDAMEFNPFGNWHLEEMPLHLIKELTQQMVKEADMLLSGEEKSANIILKKLFNLFPLVLTMRDPIVELDDTKTLSLRAEIIFATVISYVILEKKEINLNFSIDEKFFNILDIGITHPEQIVYLSTIQALTFSLSNQKEEDLKDQLRAPKTVNLPVLYQEVKDILDQQKLVDHQNDELKDFAYQKLKEFYIRYTKIMFPNKR